MLIKTTSSNIACDNKMYETLFRTIPIESSAKKLSAALLFLLLLLLCHIHMI